MKLRVLFLMVLIVSCWTVVSQERIADSDFPIIKGNYLGQEPPGICPELFAPDIYSKVHPEWVFCTEFSPDGNELFFAECEVAQDIDRIMFMKRVDDVWTKPVVTSFSGEFNDNDMRLAPDGNTIFWRSWRPLPGNNTPEDRSIIWFASRIENNWSEAQPVKCGSTYLIAGYPSITNDGTLYFSTRIEGNIGESDIHYSQFIDG